MHHQPEAQHPKSSAIHKLPADYPIFAPDSDEIVSGSSLRFRANRDRNAVQRISLKTEISTMGRGAGSLS